MLLEHNFLALDGGTTGNRQSWTERVPPLSSSARVRRQTIAMLDRFNAGENCATRAFGAG